MVTKEDVQKVVEREVLPNIENIELTSTLEKTLEPAKLHIKIRKSGWKSPNDVKLLRLDLTDVDENGKKKGDASVWYISYANTDKGKKHLEDSRRFYQAAYELVECNLMPELFRVESTIDHKISKNVGQSIASIIADARMAENDIASTVARLLGASKQSIDAVLKEYDGKTYTNNDKTLADTLWTNKEENRDQLSISLTGLVEEAKKVYLQRAKDLLHEHSTKNETLETEIAKELADGDTLLVEIREAKIDPYAPTMIIPMDIVPENITVMLSSYKASIIDQILPPERPTARGSPLTMVRTYERVIPEHAFKHKDVFGKVLQILKYEYCELQKDTWSKYAPLVIKVVDFYHDARSTRRKAQEEILKLASTTNNDAKPKGGKLDDYVT